MGNKNSYLDKSFNGGAIRDVLVDDRPADPVAPVAGQIWFNTTDGKLRIYDGTNTVDVASLADLLQFDRFQGQYDASGNVVPSSGLHAAAATDIEAGDRWVVSVAGTIAGLAFGAAALEPGDVLMALVDDATAPGDFGSIQVNKPTATTAACEEQTVNLAANTPLTVTSANLAAVCQVQTFDSLGNEIELCVQKTGATTVDITSNTALTGVQVSMSGNV